MEIIEVYGPAGQKNTTTATTTHEMSALEFDQIFEQYYQRVYKYICYQINYQAMAEDLCSQVFEQVIAKYHTYSPEKAAFDVWLFAIAKHCVTDYYRSSRKRLHFPLDAIFNVISPNPSLEEEMITAEGNQELFLALKQLRSKERHIISMKFGAGLKNSEIAGLLGISGANVGVVLHRSLKKLHKLLKMGGYERG